ncbi:MAG: hypothetical protein LAO08_04265 [Acidobacteriia bacterium]|nr:hypothetical protein [Terriglobia bacterium]
MRIGGHVAVIGVLAGARQFDPRSVLMKAVRDLTGIAANHTLEIKPTASRIRGFMANLPNWKSHDASNRHAKIVSGIVK